jgi:CRP-like cAMP-binding protein
LLRSILELIHWEARQQLSAVLRFEEPDRLLEGPDRSRRFEIVASLRMLRGVESSHLRALASCLEPLQVRTGETVVRQDQPCEGLYYIVSGVGHSEEYDVAGEMMIGAYMQAGDTFGERAFLNDNSEALWEFSVRASSKMELLRIGRRDFDNYCRSFPTVGKKIRDTVERTLRLRKTPFFQELPPSMAALLLARVRYENVPTGASVVRQGEVGHRFYIIQSGTAEATVMTPAGERRLSLMGPGDYFGEIALLLDIPRTATVKAIEPLQVGSLEKQDFLSLRRGSKGFQRDVDAVLRRRLEY